MYDLVTLIYCDYGTLCPSDRRELLRRAYASLRPEGRMILNVFSRAHAERFSAYQCWNHCPDGGSWREGAYLVLEEGFLCPEHASADVLESSPQKKKVYIICGIPAIRRKSCKQKRKQPVSRYEVYMATLQALHIQKIVIRLP